RRVEGFRHLHNDGKSVRDCHPSSTCESLRKRLPAQELHAYENAVVPSLGVSKKVVYSGNIWMGDLFSQVHFAPKSFQESSLACEIVADCFDCYCFLKLLVSSFINFPHAAGSDKANNLK